MIHRYNSLNITLRYLYNKALRSCIYICINIYLAIAGQMARPNWLKCVEETQGKETHGYPVSNIG